LSLGWPASASGGADPARLRLLAEGADKIYKVFIIRIVFDAINLVMLLMTAVVSIGSVVRAPTNSFSGAGLQGQVWRRVNVSYAGAVNISGLLAAYGIIFFVNLVASVIILYFLYKGMEALSRYNESRFGIGFLGAKLWVGGVLGSIVGFVVLLGAAAAGSAAGVFVGAIVLGLSGLAVLAAMVMVLVALWRLGGEPGDGRMRLGIAIIIAAAAVALLAAVSPLFLFIAVVLQFLGEAIVALGAKGVRDAALERIAASSFSVTA